MLWPHAKNRNRSGPLRPAYPPRLSTVSTHRDVLSVQQPNLLRHNGQMRCRAANAADETRCVIHATVYLDRQIPQIALHCLKHLPIAPTAAVLRRTRQSNQRRSDARRVAQAQSLGEKMHVDLRK